jgi:DNA-directed RNA polymerase specialized sigma24 family protein
MQTAISDPATDCADCNDTALFESAAREFYQIAALFVGDETEATKLVEETVAAVDMDPCADSEAARSAASGDLIQRALGRLAEMHPTRMHPMAAADLGGCVETDDLSAAGITQEQLDRLLSGSDRAHMRRWLESLSPVERSVFVIRAVLGRTGAQAADLLRRTTGDSWTEAHVGGAYRAALCSLASSLVHSTAH